jgi:serine/threonine protein phosphatase PrpC
MSVLTSGAASDTGLLRERNEDRYFSDPERGVFLVVDGVGGHPAGDLAAQTAVDIIRASEFQHEDSVRDAIARANNRIYELAEERPELRGMACVLTLAVVRDAQITIGHVGDSRMYLIWHGAIKKLTSDHSPVGEAEDAGELSEAEAMSHPRRNEIFRDVGSRRRSPGDPDFVEVRTCQFRPDAAILLCSDGLTDQLPAALILEIVQRYSGDPEQVVNELVEGANLADGKDNITAIFVAGPEFRGGAFSAGETTRPRTSTTRVRRSVRLWRAALLVGGVVIGMLVWMAVRR